jgi:hypothetical protein
MEHSEFPWGPENVPGLLTPLGALGWAVAAVMTLVVLYLMRQSGPDSARRKGSAAGLEEIYAYVLHAARYALRQDEYGILRGADILRRVIRTHLGGVLLAGGGLGKQLKKLGEALGEGDEKKPEKKKDKKKDDHGHGGHGGGHGGKHEPHHVVAEPVGATTTVAETVHGHSITLNIGTDLAERPAHGGGHGGAHDDHKDPHHGHDEDEDDKPLTLEEQLIVVRKAVREFEAWWSDKPARMAELRAALDDLTSPKKPDPAIQALFEERK